MAPPTKAKAPSTHQPFFTADERRELSAALSSALPPALRLPTFSQRLLFVADRLQAQDGGKSSVLTGTDAATAGSGTAPSKAVVAEMSRAFQSALIDTGRRRRLSTHQSGGSGSNAQLPAPAASLLQLLAESLMRLSAEAEAAAGSSTIANAAASSADVSGSGSSSSSFATPAATAARPPQLQRRKRRRRRCSAAAAAAPSQAAGAAGGPEAPAAAAGESFRATCELSASSPIFSAAPVSPRQLR